LQRGDIQSAFNIGQLLKQNEQYAPAQATATQLQNFSPAMSLFGTLSAEDQARYQAAMNNYQYQLEAQKPTGNLGGVGSLLGAGLGAALAIPTGGISLAALPAMAAAGSLGGMAGGGIGSLWNTYR